MTLPITDLITPADAPTWLARILANAATLQLQTTSWQAGGMARTILAVVSNLMAQEDGLISGIAQGGFLDYAASGSVTYTTSDGTIITQPVTPDPSIPAQNPTGTPGWLDLLADSVYNVQRIGAEQASGTVAIANTSAATYGAYAAGGYHVANPATGATFSNTTVLTITPGTLVGGGVTGASNTAPIQITTSTAHGLTTGAVVQIAGVGGNTAANGFATITVTSSTQFTLNGSSGVGSWTSGGTVLPCQTATFAADVAGPTGTSATGQISQAVTSNNGVSVSNPVPFFGAPYESNQALAARCRARIQSISVGGPQGAYVYFATAAYQLLLAQTPPVQLSAPITRAIKQTSTSTGVVTVVIANAAGVVPGAVQLAISGATNATPIVLTTAGTVGLAAGTYSVIVSGVLGNTAANGSWTATVNSTGTSITLTSSAGNAAYTGGGSIEIGDLGLVDSIIQSSAVPDSVTETTVSAAGWPVTIAASVVVPQAQVAAYTAAAQVAIALYFASLPIGGATAGVLQYNDIVGTLFAAGSVNGQQSYVVSLPVLTLNGASGNASFSSSLAVAVPTLNLVVSGV